MTIIAKGNLARVNSLANQEYLPSVKEGCREQLWHLFYEIEEAV
jgi:hypothetical protein